MFGISLPEILVVLAIILMVFGPEKLPEAARQFGKMMAFLRKNSEEMRREFYQTLYTPAEEARRGLDEVKRELKTESNFIKREISQEHKAQTEANSSESQVSKQHSSETADAETPSPKTTGVRGDE